jgi:hypothetical protein
MNHWDLTVERYLEGFNALDGDLLNNGFGSRFGLILMLASTSRAFVPSAFLM